MAFLLPDVASDRHMEMIAMECEVSGRAREDGYDDEGLEGKERGRKDERVESWHRGHATDLRDEERNGEERNGVRIDLASSSDDQSTRDSPRFARSLALSDRREIIEEGEKMSAMMKEMRRRKEEETCSHETEQGLRATRLLTRGEKEGVEMWHREQAAVRCDDAADEREGGRRSGFMIGSTSSSDDKSALDSPRFARSLVCLTDERSL
ncbi:hypothetical protein PRIPAC_92332 [Pristionchus pacificus]|uniref:Uncharacterized protein n=1 Tax=Pristionchus pacificus TaxID=54126 RepID=A0A2A6BIM5_PRIPA|nr:hypothetical protein PRIPAC_92332 [Pristionchus pacificus]|eukprot:PDM65703.1 hypothetical protein PRIPAC_45617 [Pristionchus pacificus]